METRTRPKLTDIDTHICIGVWTAQGKIPSYQFRDFYIHMQDYQYPYLDATAQVCYDPLTQWVLADQKARHTSTIFPTAWLSRTLEIMNCLTAIYTRPEQAVILQILQTRQILQASQNKKKVG